MTNPRGPVSASNHKITDQHNRTFDYLRIAVNERCNLRCLYCMPEAGLDFISREDQLQKDEILRVVRVVSEQGVNKIRYTGGEPLLRADMADIITQTIRLPGIESVHITTNGLLLPEKAKALKQAGLHGVNISLDTLREDRFLQITRRSGADRVLAGLQAALDLDFDSVKLNMVVMRGFNDDELADFVALTRENRLTVRFIELMPFDAHQIWKTGHFMGAELMLNFFTENFPGLEKDTGSSTEEHVFRLPKHKGKFAVIPAYTRSLCATCSRIRLTADGFIRNCLYANDEHHLLPLLRNGATDSEIGDFIKAAMWQKPVDGWKAQKQADNGKRGSMTMIGG